MITSILVFLAVLSLLVLVHEFGHFIMARRAGIWVEEFGFGLPPRIWGKKVGETLYSINLLPIGGFVRLHGENVEEGITQPKRAFLNKSKKARVSVIVAGVVMNFLLAIAAFAISYSVSGVPKNTENVKVTQVTQNSPADNSGIVAGDIVRSVNGSQVSTVEAFVSQMSKNKGVETEIGIERINGEKVVKRVTPRENPPEGEGALGVAITTTEVYFPPIWARPFYGIYYGFGDALFWGGAVFAGLAKLITDLFSGHVGGDVAGPVGIYALTSQVATFGLLAVINFIGILSVNLAIFNILPFPALDGGRLLFIVIEAIFGRRVVPKIEAAIHSAGMVILLMLILAITVFDVKRLISAGSIAGFLESVTK